MFSFFRGWKRKIGVVTLVLACVFAAGWVRSSARIDSVIISCGGLRCVFLSGSQKFRLVFHQRVEFSLMYPGKDGEKLDHYTLDERSFEKNWFNHFQHKGRLLEASFNDNGPKISIWLIPYWSIVIPLTLLSAYLLLGKPRPFKPQTSESAPTTGI